MAGRVNPARGGARFAFGRDLPPAHIVRSGAESVAQLLAAVQDIAQYDDIHQAAERLDAVQAWIRREADAAAADPIFDDDRGVDFQIRHASA